MSEITVLNPLFIWLLPLCLLPIVFHLFYRFKKNILTFPSFMFFFMIDRHFSARRRLREFIILLLRVLGILFFLAACAGLVWHGGGRAKSSKVIIIDNSGSMGGPGINKRPKLKDALEGSKALINNLAPGDSAGLLLLVDDPTLPLPNGLVNNRKTLKLLLKKISPTDAAGQVGNALKKAFTMLENSVSPQTEIHIFTDLQNNEWEKRLYNLETYRPKTKIFLHKIKTEPLKSANVSIKELQLPKKRLISGRKFFCKAILYNSSDFDADIQLIYNHDSGKKDFENIKLKGKSEKNVSFPVSSENPGLHWCHVQIKGDFFEPDNQAYAVFFTEEKKNVLLVGNKTDLGVLPFAISPTGTGEFSGLMPYVIPMTDLSQSIREKHPVLIVMTWAELSKKLKSDNAGLATELSKHISNGNNMLIVPGINDKMAIPDMTGNFTGAKLGAHESWPNGTSLIVFNEKLFFWNDMKDDQGKIIFRNLRAYQLNKIIPDKTTQPLIGTEDGIPVIGMMKLGDGNVFTSGISFSPKWSNIPLKGSFLALVQTMGLYGNAKPKRLLAVTAGDTCRVETGNQPGLHVRSLTGSPMDWKGDQLPIFPRTGIYTTSIDGNELNLAISSAHKEGEHKFIKGNQVPILQGINYHLQIYHGVPGLLNTVEKLARGFNMYIMFLILALCAFLLEGLLAIPSKSGILKQPGNKVLTVFITCGTLFLSSFELDAADNALNTSMLQWHNNINPVFAALLIIISAFWLYIYYQRLRMRMTRKRALPLMLIRVLILLLIIIAIFDPVWVTEKKMSDKGKLLTLVDISSSMDIQDDNQFSRATRAKKILTQLKDVLHSDMSAEEWEFDTQLYQSAQKKRVAKDTEIRGTDFAGSLLSLAEVTDISSFKAVIVLTDGGDETIEISELPSVPLYIVGIGTPSSSWNDIDIMDLEYPQTIEKDIDFEINTDLEANTGHGNRFKQKLLDVHVTLEKKKDEKKWIPIKVHKVNLLNKRARVRFKLNESEPGIKHYRITVKDVTGELSTLNNTMKFAVDIRKKSLRILYFTRNIGMNFKILRSELARDPGINFTALFPTVGNRFTIQGDRNREIDSALEDGFPDKSEKMKIFDCLILGSMPVDDWRKEQINTLMAYIEEGGAVIFLGGEFSFGGSYGLPPVSSLVPWRVRIKRSEFLRGKFPVSIPRSAVSNPIIAGINEILTRNVNPFIESVNITGPLKSSAVSLMNSNVSGQNISICAVQPYGKGHCLGLATNTFWKWGTSTGSLRKAYGLFWRQAVRNLTEQTDSGGTVSIKWDKESYRPGETAKGIIRVNRDKQMTMRFAASLTFKNETVSLPVVPIKNEKNVYSVTSSFKERGEYQFRLVSYLGNQTPETYEKNFIVAPLQAECANLEVDQEYLKRLAKKTGGFYVNEKDINTLFKEIQQKISRQTILTQISPIYSYPYYFFLFLILLTCEWILRRKQHLI